MLLLWEKENFSIQMGSLMLSALTRVESEGLE